MQQNYENCNVCVRNGNLLKMKKKKSCIPVAKNSQAVHPDITTLKLAPLDADLDVGSDHLGILQEGYVSSDVAGKKGREFEVQSKEIMNKHIRPLTTLNS